MNAPKLICLMGPTAAGKTGLAVALAERHPLDIISVDSALVYRGMDIGTAKPDRATLARAPHRLVDIREPSEPYSAADFREDALAEIAAIHGAGRVPLLVGGTMLYFRALLDGLSDLPPADEKLRAELEARAVASGWPALHGELAALDPAAAQRIEPTDPQRIQRALEVIALTGRPMSELQRERAVAAPAFDALKVIVAPRRRSELHRRIARRLDAMLAEGFEAEARALRARDEFDPDLPAYRAVGYRQAWPWLAGEIGKAEFRERALAATRQLAKRQLTWLRREKDALWYYPPTETNPGLHPGDATGGVFDVVGKFLESSRGRSQLDA